MLYRLVPSRRCHRPSFTCFNICEESSVVVDYEYARFVKRHDQHNKTTAAIRTILNKMQYNNIKQYSVVLHSSYCTGVEIKVGKPKNDNTPPGTAVLYHTRDTIRRALSRNLKRGMPVTGRVTLSHSSTRVLLRTSGWMKW